MAVDALNLPRPYRSQASRSTCRCTACRARERNQREADAAFQAGLPPRINRSFGGSTVCEPEWHLRSQRRRP